MSDNILADWGEAARSHPFIIRDDLERHMAALSGSMLGRLSLRWNGKHPAGSAKRRGPPRLNPTKGYRGAHKYFRGGRR